MFVKTYRYRISKQDFKEWKRITDRSNKMYQGYGAIGLQRFARKGERFIDVVEVGYFASKRNFRALEARINADPRIRSLFDEFLKLVGRTGIIEEEFEVV